MLVEGLCTVLQEQLSGELVLRFAEKAQNGLPWRGHCWSFLWQCSRLGRNGPYYGELSNRREGSVHSADRLCSRSEDQQLDRRGRPEL
ncbi:hypothetical protein M8818_003579 [Zalaria obscura]|uniref:Uncharacterized protein n=1 Tax=Zalaria obscura TaxID=2024903 RepID=A0ACC3SFJ0_9PEZI